ncbi:DUF4238 domain-containing protein [Fodinicurvata sp. EGI_FJ10296]|uniref:DUF4238 domain-containing protein n=1 Tax=Fodinicurvata sp. EGI_FJ10296 TaxID=3231908 RepID=UPI00345625E2
MTTPKKHHFVPQMLLRNFCDVDGKIWHYNKKFGKRRVISANPESIFFNTNLYRIETGQNNDLSAERYFSHMEGLAKPVIDKMCISARNGKIPALTDEDKKIWNMFLFLQWKRTPDSLSELKENVDMEVLINDCINDFGKIYRSLADEERRNYFTTNVKQRMSNNAWIMAIGHFGPEVEAAIRDMSIAIAVIRKSKKSFIIGSRPVAKLTPPSTSHLGHPGVEVWLPVASDVAIGIFAGKGKDLVIQLNDFEWLREFNFSIYIQSTVIAGRSERLVKSLITAR